MDVQNVIRFLAWYERDLGDRLVGRTGLKNITLAELQTLFQTASDDLMYDCYPVTHSISLKLQDHVDTVIELNKFDYFVEAELTD